jgi:small subunit ribosomal protein S17
MTRGTSRRKVRVGIVTSDKMHKTIVVRVDRRVMHPFYRKVITRSKSHKVHDPDNSCRIGDVVRIEETRPLSKEKRWRVVEIVSRME